MVLGVGVDVVSIQVNSIFVSPVVPAEHAIRVDNRHQIKYKLLTQNPGHLGVLEQSLENTVHDVTRRYFSGMHPSTDEDSSLSGSKHSRPYTIWKEHPIVNMFLLFGNVRIGTYRYQLNWTILKGKCQCRSMEVHVGHVFGLLLKVEQELVVVLS